MFLRRGAIGVLLGIAMSLSPGWLFIGIAAAGTAWLVQRAVAPEHKRFVALLFLAGFALRAFLSLGLDLGSRVVEGEFPSYRAPAQDWDLGIDDKSRHYMGIGDSDYYSARGWALTEYVRGSREPVVLLRLNQYGWNGYVELIGFFYSVFGFSPSAVKGINCLLGAGCGALIFFITLWMFGSRIARWAAAAVTFFPSLVFWSASNLKDIPFIFLTLLAVFCFIRIIQARGIAQKILYALLLAVTLSLHHGLREDFWRILLLTMIVGTLFARFGVRAWLLAAGAGLAGTWFLLHNGAAQARFRAALSPFLSRHIGYANTDGLTYTLFPPALYDPGYLPQWIESGNADIAIAALIKAPVHFFLEPFPGRFDSSLHLLPLAQMAFWYLMLALAAIGLATAFRRRNRPALGMLFPLLVFAWLIGFSNGNIGTLFRIRDLVTPFLLIYAAAGLERLLRPEVAAESRLVRATARLRQAVSLTVERVAAQGTERWKRFVSGFSSSPVRNAAQTLLIAVGTHLLLVSQGGINWTISNAVFYLGLLFLVLWGLAIRSDWADLTRGSRV